MNTYRVTIDARRSDTLGGAPRTFQMDIRAHNPYMARASLGNRPVVDPSDQAWFDEWRITRTQKVQRWEVVTTDNTAWHSRGLTGITVLRGKREARMYLKRTLERLTPGQGAFMRKEV
ncbi:MAG TPA: hypothetical protein VFX53_05080 [Pedococcus sp.]|nr:hypothetical protein [Pedococcus sp.]